jgi:hypothetical protein
MAHGTAPTPSKRFSFREGFAFAKTRSDKQHRESAHRAEQPHLDPETNCPAPCKKTHHLFWSFLSPMFGPSLSWQKNDHQFESKMASQKEISAAGFFRTSLLHHREAVRLQENGTFLSFSLCLSRACLGKIWNFLYVKSGRKVPFLLTWAKVRLRFGYLLR